MFLYEFDRRPDIIGTMTLSDLAPNWIARARQLEPYAPAAAAAFVNAARELEEALSTSAMEPLDLATASLESGYTRGHLRRMIREGTIPNAGSDEAPLILRGHLPKKPGHGLATTRPQHASSRVQVARAVAYGD